MARLTIAFLAISAASIVLADEKVDIPQLVAQLNSSSESERSSAYRSLLDAGAGVFPHIAEGLKYKDLDAASRAEQVVYWMLRSQNKGVAGTAESFVKQLESSEDPVIKRRLHSIERRMERFERERDAKLKALLSTYGATVSDNGISGLSVYIRSWRGGAEDLLLLQKLKNIKQLRIYSNGFTDREFRFIGELGTVESLTINEPGMTKAAFKYLKKLDNLKMLNIELTSIDAEGLKELVFFKKLTSLNPPRQSTDEALKSVKSLKSLTTLSLTNCSKIKGAGLEYLAGMKSLTMVNLPSAGIEGEHYAHLAKIPKLRQLYLPRSMTDADLEKIKDLKNLQILNCMSNRITNKGLAHLAGLTELRSLHLNYAKITSDGLKHLYNLKELQSLYLSRNSPISDEAVKVLREKLPKLQNVYH